MRHFPGLILLLLLSLSFGQAGADPASPPPAQADTPHATRPAAGSRAALPFRQAGGKKSAIRIAQGVQAAFEALPLEPWHEKSVWDARVLESQPALKARLQSFLDGECGASVKTLKVAGLTREQLADLLEKKGFTEHKPLSARRSPAGSGAPRSTPPNRQQIYIHPDGGIVRIKPLGHRWHPTPHAVKTVMYKTTPETGPGETTSKEAAKIFDPTSWANEAFKVTDEGYPVPKSPKPGEGLRHPGADMGHPDALFGWVDAIMESAHADLTPSPDTAPALEKKS
jgi:hypothetical protein